MIRVVLNFFLIAVLSACSEVGNNNNPDEITEMDEIEESDTTQIGQDDTGEDTIQEDTIKVDKNESNPLTYLALGDSYTIGERVDETMRWPVLLVNKLRPDFNVKDPQIIARTGWTTDELQLAIDNRETKPPYDLVSLLIGVNNQYRGYNIEQYQVEFEALLKQSIGFAGGDTSRVFVVSIPDYGVTPFGERIGSERIAKEIDEYNRIAKGCADRYNIQYFNITEISRKAKNEPDLVANDGLHPSGKMYSEWVELIYPWVYGEISN